MRPNRMIYYFLTLQAFLYLAGCYFAFAYMELIDESIKEGGHITNFGLHLLNIGQLIWVLLTVVTAILTWEKANFLRSIYNLDSKKNILLNWMILGWFIPIVNLIMPMVLIRKLGLLTTKKHEIQSRNYLANILVIVWCLFWVALFLVTWKHLFLFWQIFTQVNGLELAESYHMESHALTAHFSGLLISGEWALLIFYLENLSNKSE